MAELPLRGCGKEKAFELIDPERKPNENRSVVNKGRSRNEVAASGAGDIIICSYLKDCSHVRKMVLTAKVNELWRIDKRSRRAMRPRHSNAGPQRDGLVQPTPL